MEGRVAAGCSFGWTLEFGIEAGNAVGLTVRIGSRCSLFLNPEEPTFLGFLIMISLYKSLKR